MDQATQIALVRRVLAHVEARTTDTAAAPTTLATDAYTDEARHAREIERLFRRLPLVVAHVSELRAPGDFVTHDASGVPLLVVRGDDGALRAFVNVCRHRGTRVESRRAGHAKSFVCPYHAWTYGRAGDLRGVPHERAFGIVKEERGLFEVPLFVAAGLVFVTPSPMSSGDAKPAEPASWLGAITKDLEGFGIPNAFVRAPRDQMRALSYKLSVDIFLETYHLRSAHAKSIYPMFFDNLGLVDPIGPHLRNLFPKRSIRELAGADPATWELRRHANVLYHLFPSTLVLVEPDHAAVLQIWPDGPSRTRLVSFSLVPEDPAAMSDKARAYWDANDAILYGAVDEDFALGESIQRGLAAGARAGANPSGVVFGAFEHALAHFHRTIDEHLR